MKIQLYNYTLEFQGQFVNTRFDYFFKLNCDFLTEDKAAWIEIEFLNKVNNYSQVMP